MVLACVCTNATHNHNPKVKGTAPPPAATCPHPTPIPGSAELELHAGVPRSTPSSRLTLSSPRSPEKRDPHAACGPHICTDRAALSTSVSKRLCNGDLYFPVDSRAQRVHTHTLIDPPAPRWSETHMSARRLCNAEGNGPRSPTAPTGAAPMCPMDVTHGTSQHPRHVCGGAHLSRRSPPTCHDRRQIRLLPTRHPPAAGSNASDLRPRGHLVDALTHMHMLRACCLPHAHRPRAPEGPAQPRHQHRCLLLTSLTSSWPRPRAP